MILSISVRSLLSGFSEYRINLQLMLNRFPSNLRSLLSVLFRLIIRPMLRLCIRLLFNCFRVVSTTCFKDFRFVRQVFVRFVCNYFSSSVRRLLNTFQSCFDSFVIHVRLLLQCFVSTGLWLRIKRDIRWVVPICLIQVMFDSVSVNVQSVFDCVCFESDSRSIAFPIMFNGLSITCWFRSIARHLVLVDTSLFLSVFSWVSNDFKSYSTVFSNMFRLGFNWVPIEIQVTVKWCSRGFQLCFGQCSTDVSTSCSIDAITDQFYLIGSQCLFSNQVGLFSR